MVINCIEIFMTKISCCNGAPFMPLATAAAAAQRTVPPAAGSKFLQHAAGYRSAIKQLEAAACNLCSGKTSLDKCQRHLTIKNLEYWTESVALLK